MKLLDLIKMLKLFPSDSPIQNCPNKGYYYLREETDLAFVMGESSFAQNDSSSLAAFIAVLENWQDRGVTGDVYLVPGMHQSGTKVKGLLFTIEGIRFVAQEHF